MDTKTKAMFASYGRAFAGAALAAYLTLGAAPLDLRLEDLAVLVNAGIGALVITAVNYFRAGETRFGRGSADLGMGGADVLEPPEGQISDKSLALVHGVERADGPTSNLFELQGIQAEADHRSVEDQAPVQTDNRPREGDPDPLPLPDETFQNEMR